MPDPVVAPELVGGAPSALCSLGVSPQRLTGHLVQLLRAYFSDPANLADPALRGALWRPDNTSGIAIESAGRWAQGLVEVRPAIVVRRHAWQAQRLAPGDRAGGGYLVRVLAGSHTAFAIAGEAAEAETLGWEVAGMFASFAAEIARDLGLLRMELAQVGEPFAVEEATQNFAVPVTVAYGLTYDTLVRDEAPPLKTLALSVTMAGT